MDTASPARHLSGRWNTPQPAKTLRSVRHDRSPLVLLGSSGGCLCGGYSALAIRSREMNRRDEHPLYRTWKTMRRRCNWSKDRQYEDYGGRGIYVCEEWADFLAFVRDMEPRPSGCTLDRRDNDGPYAPWNCRWATPYEQSQNSRSVKFITHDGMTLSRRAWARRLGIGYSTLRERVQKFGTQKAILMGPAIGYENGARQSGR